MLCVLPYCVSVVSKSRGILERTRYPRKEGQKEVDAHLCTTAYRCQCIAPPQFLETMKNFRVLSEPCGEMPHRIPWRVGGAERVWDREWTLTEAGDGASSDAGKLNGA